MDSLTLLYDFGKTKVLQRFFIAKGCKRKHRFLQVRRSFLILFCFSKKIICIYLKYHKSILNISQKQLLAGVFG